jgi:hypothetical protein
MPIKALLRALNGVFLCFQGVGLLKSTLWAYRGGATLGLKCLYSKVGSPFLFEILCRGSFEHPLELVAQHLMGQRINY